MRPEPSNRLPCSHLLASNRLHSQASNRLHSQTESQSKVSIPGSTSDLPVGERFLATPKRPPFRLDRRSEAIRRSRFRATIGRRQLRPGER